ncbi:hypothetical protein TIFTF001_025253 [Ficus carica]|uniref:Uncharacterized protein n=1 Tax=Ficus carica TaxID=3494 RepID=A0AA88DKI7_FICCA|nr:hypothetical protein TIFTF001_025253 [Ficus carica]
MIRSPIELFARMMRGRVLSKFTRSATNSDTRAFGTRTCITMFLKRNHAAGASGSGSVTMGGGSTAVVDFDFSMDNFGTNPVLEEETTPTNGGRQANSRRAADNTGSSRSRGSAGKRKQRDATDEMTYSAMQEIVNHFRSRSHLGTSSNQSSRQDHLLNCMNSIKEMGISHNQRAIMWHYFAGNPKL